MSCEEKCVRAFKNKDHSTAIALLPSLQKHNDIRCGYGYLVDCAARNGWRDIVELLTTQYGCDPHRKDNMGWTALHYAAWEGHLDVTRYLVLHCKCNINATILSGNTPLHLAADLGHLDVLQCLVQYGGDVIATNVDGDTPLHYACQSNYNNSNIPVIKYLLCIPAVLNAFTKGSDYGYELPRDSVGDAKAVYSDFQRVQVSHPVGSFINVFFLGNPGAGKTTLCQAIKDRPKNVVQSVRHFFVKSQVKSVKLCTAGIVPNKLRDDILGPVIIHDFAGQPEYYSSHTAVLESLLQNSGAVFVVVINLTQDLSQQVRFWSNIVINERQKVSSECHLTVIGSHADQVREQLKQKMFEVENEFGKELADVEHTITSIFPLDCRICSKDNLQPFIESLSHLCTSLRNKQAPVISLYCNFLYSILEAKVSEDNVCNLEKLMSLCDESREEGVPLPDDVLLLLKTLHSSGLIVYLENTEDFPKSWIVVSKEILLTEVDGILFAPSDFKEHHDNIASNTGIITSSTLQQLFPRYSSDMLIGFLKSMKLCEELDKTLLTLTNLECNDSDACDKLLFFPALITKKRPEHIKKQFKIWWCLKVTSKHSFSVRFLHVLLLQLAFQYSLSVDTSLPGDLKRRCILWINGIHWYNNDGIETLVEQLDDNRCVMVAMSCLEGAEEDMIRLHCEITKTIVQLQQEYCPILQCKEYLLAPKQEYPLDDPSKTDLYDMEQLKSCISQGKRAILCVAATDAPPITITELLPIEPKTYLSIYQVS